MIETKSSLCGSASSLLAVAPEPKCFWIVEGAHHNDILETAGQRFRQRLQAFYEELPGSRRGDLSRKWLSDALDYFRCPPVIANPQRNVCLGDDSNHSTRLIHGWNPFDLVPLH